MDFGLPKSLFVKTGILSMSLVCPFPAFSTRFVFLPNFLPFGLKMWHWCNPDEDLWYCYDSEAQARLLRGVQRGQRVVRILVDGKVAWADLVGLTQVIPSESAPPKQGAVRFVPRIALILYCCHVFYTKSEGASCWAMGPGGISRVSGNAIFSSMEGAVSTTVVPHTCFD